MCAGRFAVVDDPTASDHDGGNVERGRFGCFDGRLIDHDSGVEEHEIGNVALRDAAAVPPL
jgi:hypothetical protein